MNANPSHPDRRSARALAMLVATLVAIGCSTYGSTDPGSSGTPGGSLHFLTENSTAPGPGTASVSFYAVDGQTRSGSIYYHHDADDSLEAGDDSTDSTRLATLTIPAGALTTDSTGAPLAPGDSVLVTLTLVDTAHLEVSVGPSWLQFSSTTPATLDLAYQEADSSVAPGNASALAIWRQPQGGGNWFKLPSTVNTATQRVQAHIPGRSVYATAY
jgi:hypothetical protein